MNDESPQQAHTRTSWFSILIATLGWWIVPIAVRLSPRHDEPSAGLAFGCVIGLAIALSLCAQSREKRWVVLLWVPVLVWTSFGALTTLGAVASEPHGGPNAAPLEGVALLLSLIHI